MALPNSTLEQIKTADFKKFPDPSILHQPMDVGLWALWLLQEYFGLTDHFTAKDISQVLLNTKQKLSFQPEMITKGFTRAHNRIHKNKNLHEMSYMIQQPGKEYLATFITNGYGTKDEYFSQFVGGSIHAFFLLQVDLANHTKWFREKQVEKNTAKKKLAVLLTTELQNKYEFHRLFWAGDGGVFVRTSEATKDYDVVVEAADTIYQLFAKWKKQNNNLDTKSLDIRVSAHWSQIFADEDPGFWTSEELNNFIKYERNISEGGFAITKQIRDKLTSSKQSRFNIRKGIPNKDGATVMEVFQDSKHKL